jgi:hypothetical protein
LALAALVWPTFNIRRFFQWNGVVLASYHPAFSRRRQPDLGYATGGAPA